MADYRVCSGYQVYLSNNRAVFDMGHRNLKRSDPRFWDYNIRELALFDLPAVVEHVKQETGYSQVRSNTESNRQ